MSSRELERAEIMGRVGSGDLKLSDAAVMLELSYRQAKRLWRRYRQVGSKGLKHGNAGRPSNRSKPSKLRRRVLNLIRKKYSGSEEERFGPTLAAEHLAEEDGIDLSRFVTNGSITWSSVAVSPNLNGDFPREPRQTRYYAARETSSTPLRLKTNTGDQLEKFLFYRGVSSARLPVSARQTSDGKLTVKTLIGAQIPAAILFERRGERVGYRIESAADEMVIDPPLLTGNVDTLAIDLEGILVEQGLYPDEAHAMVETWKDSWFEEGSRLIYIVPRGFIDKVLPLTITPSPDQILRVFVGRLEIVTPATTQAVESALASKDEVPLNKYRRFLEPIQRIAMQEDARSSQ